MPTLREISIHGYWCHEAKVGVMLGLQQRPRSVPALRKMSFDSYLGGLNSKEYRPLWDAVFSLPELDELEIVLGDKFADIDLIQERWCRSKRQCRLKSLHITPVVLKRHLDAGVLPQIAREYHVRIKENSS